MCLATGDQEFFLSKVHRDGIHCLGSSLFDCWISRGLMPAD